MFKRPSKEQYDKFRVFFNMNLGNYWNIVTGFNIIKFDEDLNHSHKEGSLKDYLKEKFGEPAMNLIQELL